MEKGFSAEAFVTRPPPLWPLQVPSARRRERAPALAAVVCSQHPTLPAGNCFAERKRDSAPSRGRLAKTWRATKKRVSTQFLRLIFRRYRVREAARCQETLAQARNRSHCAEHLQGPAKITSAFLRKTEAKRLSGEANSGKVLACHFPPFFYPLLLYFLIFQSRADRSTSTNPNFLGIMLYSLRFTPSRSTFRNFVGIRSKYKCPSSHGSH